MERKCFLTVRIRGGVNVPARIESTLKMLRLDKNNTATLLDDRPEYLGMIQMAKDLITWGEPTQETIRILLEERGETPGGGKIDTDTVKALGFESIDELSKALSECAVDITKLESIKPFFRLHPPRKGFKRTVKRPYNAGGELGYRREAINELVQRMC